MTQQTLLACALERIDTVNRADPNIEQVGGIPLPKEYAYSQHMTRWLFERSTRVPDSACPGDGCVRGPGLVSFAS